MKSLTTTEETAVFQESCVLNKGTNSALVTRDPRPVSINFKFFPLLLGSLNTFLSISSLILLRLCNFCEMIHVSCLLFLKMEYEGQG